VIETGETDTANSTALYVPDLGQVVSGDVAYDHCHMYVGGTTADHRAEWIAALDKLASPRPAAVVTGHKNPTRATRPRSSPSPGNISNTTESYARQT
jgi:glyoxylase-like metal-dependent hydrolase (beta-lactamase superfamily II)